MATELESIWENGDDGPFTEGEIALLRIFDVAADDGQRTRLLRKSVATFDALAKRNEALVKALEEAAPFIHYICDPSDGHIAGCIAITQALAANRSRTNESEG